MGFHGSRRVMSDFTPSAQSRCCIFYRKVLQFVPIDSVWFSPILWFIYVIQVCAKFLLNTGPKNNAGQYFDVGGNWSPRGNLALDRATLSITGVTFDLETNPGPHR